MLNVIDPSRATTGNHGQGRRFLWLVESCRGQLLFVDQSRFVEILGEPLQKLRPLLQNRQVGSKVGVKHIIEIHFFQCAGHLTGDTVPWFIPKFFTQGCTDGWRGLNDHGLRWVLQCLPDNFRCIFFFQRVYRAYRCALTAKSTCRRIQRQILSGANHRCKPSELGIQNANTLNIIADRDTPSAKDAFGRIPNDRRRRVVDVFFGFFSFKPGAVDLNQFTQLLEFAVSVPRTFEAVFGMVGNHQFINDFSRIPNSFGVGLNHHALCCHCDTRGLQVFGTGLLYHTDSARSVLVYVLKVAHGWNEYVILFRRFQNGGAFGYCDWFVIDCQIYHLRSPPLP